MNRMIKFIQSTKYNVGFIHNDVESIINGEPFKINWLKHSYKDRWFADPFILDVSDSIISVLVEEWYDPIQRGRISKLIVDKQSYELLEVKVMLDEGFHLSFPSITRKSDGLYIQPECSASGKLCEYRYNEDSDSFSPCAVISDFPLTDSVRNDLFGRDLLFSTMLPDANGKDLGIFLWNSSSNKYELNDIYHFEDNISRMAGNFFTNKDKIYRPAQVCIKSYGDAVSIQEVSVIDGKWNFKEIRRLYSPDPNLNLGFHTFNVYKNLIVIDALGFRKPRLCRMLQGVKKAANSIVKSF